MIRNTNFPFIPFIPYEYNIKGVGTRTVEIRKLKMFVKIEIPASYNQD